MNLYDSIISEMEACDCRPFQEIQNEFQSRLYSLDIHTSNIPSDSKEFLNTVAMIRRRIERSAFAKVDGVFYYVADENAYLKSLKTRKIEHEKDDLKSLIAKEMKQLANHYGHSDFDIKLIIKPFPAFTLHQYEIDELNKDIQETCSNLVMDIYSRVKHELLSPIQVMDTTGKFINVEEIMISHPQIFHGKEAERKKYYQDQGFDNNIIAELDNKNMLWYYYKIMTKKDATEAINRVLRPRVLDGFYSLYHKAKFFYETTRDKEFYKQYQLLEEAYKYVYITENSIERGN